MLLSNKQTAGLMQNGAGLMQNGAGLMQDGAGLMQNGARLMQNAPVTLDCIPGPNNNTPGLYQAPVPLDYTGPQ